MSVITGPDYHRINPAGDLAVGNYVEEGRELALRCLPGAYKKDSPIAGNCWSVHPCHLRH